ncbi:MAG: transposase [Pseudomonadales bacterium]|nr:transposase [Pseudomonadales bacterium]
MLTVLNCCFNLLCISPSSLCRHVDDGWWPIDNNAVEKRFRPFVIGRKNWIFSTSLGGAKVNNLNSHDYLKHVFTILPQAESLDDIDKLLPRTVGQKLGC